jgi:diacylglycerol diphosphate phosphatase/phosphatidate phosphatase
MTTSSDAPRRRTSPALASPTVHLLQRKDILGTIARSWTTSYIPDYIGLALILLLYILLVFFVTPFHRLFVLSDHHIQYPHAEVERVPPLMLLAYGLGIPLLAVTVWAVLAQPGTHKARVTYLGLVTAVFLTTLVTDIIKNAVGRPRPDLLARCKPAQGTPVDVLVDVNVCTQTSRHLLQDGWRSFPSGHSSFSFSGLGFIGFLIAGQLHVLRPTTSLPSVMAAGLPFLGALLIAISRCEDYRHDVYDVTTGSVLGILFAWLSYRRYYPGLRSRKCDIPYPEKAEMVKWEMRKAGGNGNDARDEESRVGFVVGDDEESEDERERIEAGRLLGGGARSG